MLIAVGKTYGLKDQYKQRTRKGSITITVGENLWKIIK